MSRTRSLRVQLTATFVAVGAILVAAGYCGAAWLLHRAVWRPVDAALRAEANALALLRETDDAGRAGDAEPGEGIDDLTAAAARLGARRDRGAGKFVTITSVTGGLVASSGHPPIHIPSTDVAPIGERARFIPDGAHLYRAVTHRIPGFGSITVGVRVDSYARLLHGALTLLGAGTVAMLGAIGLLAWAITTRATREIDALTNELEGLEADSIGRRLEPRGTTEVARLADTLNRLLGRMDLAARRLKRFTADAAHELRTPLAALRAHLDVALARPPALDVCRNGLLDASEQTERLATLAEDLLTLSVIESDDRPIADIVDTEVLANEVAEFLEPVAQEQDRAFTVVIRSRAIVRGDPRLLKRLLLNLLGNAFAHTERGVPVHLEVRRAGSAVVIEVRDRGRGIDPAEQEALFERFAARRTGRGGSGLGLAICREIVARHGGVITVQSGIDRGTTVTVRLPALDDFTTLHRRTLDRTLTPREGGNP